MFNHHAQLIEGDEISLKKIVKKLQEFLKIGENHPDLRIFSFSLEKLGVDDAHTIRDAILSYPVEASHRVVAIYASQITEQAQNALLKITEEPPKHSWIVLVTPFIPHLLPTLRSRFVIYRFDDEHDAVVARLNEKIDKDFIISSEEFMKMSVDKRLGAVKDIHTAMDKEEVGIGQVWNFVNEIERKVQEKIKNENALAKNSPISDEEKIKILEALLLVQKYIHGPGNSVKMLLEYLAVALPKI